jgi:hypothetical protein
MRERWRLLLGLTLVVASALCFGLQLILFHRASDTFFYVLQDLGFAFINVLLVTLVVDQLLRRREVAALQHKLNMVIGAFFTEVGTTLLKYLSLFDVHLGQIREIARIGDNWSKREFSAARRSLETYDYSIDCHCADLQDLKELLTGQSRFFLDLLANPSLMEHESFTSLLWAVTHLAQELGYREDLENLPEPDYRHLEEDMRRVYTQLTYQWLLYVWHLQHDYPYLYKFVLRRSPFEDRPD